MEAPVSDVPPAQIMELRGVAREHQETFVLQVTGRHPMRFSGERIGFGTSKRHDASAWRNVTLYKTESGEYVADVEHWFALPKMTRISEVVSSASAVELLTALEEPDGTLDLAVQGACSNALMNDPQFDILHSKPLAAA
jgi:hypothetical protein